MVGIIHPFSLATRDLPHLPLYELVWIAWNHHRGEREHFEECVVCSHVGEWCLDLIWSKWKHKHYRKYNEFIYYLIDTDVFDKHMNAVASCDLPQTELFLCFFSFLVLFKYIIVILVNFLKYINMATHKEFYYLTFRDRKEFYDNLTCQGHKPPL